MNDKNIKRYLLLHHEEYLKDKENLHYAEEGFKEVMRAGESTRDIPYGRRDRNRVSGHSHPAAIRTIERKIPRDFLERGYINLRGLKVNTVQELADTLQIYRNPKFETFRVIYLKESKIIAVDGITSKLPGVCCVFKDNNYKIGTYKMIQKMERIQADGYYLTHNHPSGNILPSMEDLRLTNGFITEIPGFKGHIIIDHTKYTLIDRNLQCKEFSIPLEFQVDVFEKATFKTLLLNEKISSADQMANVMKLIQQTDKTSTVIYLSSQLEINQIQEISNKIISNDYNFANYIKNEMLRTGSTKSTLCTKDEKIYYESSQLIATKHFVDVMYFTDEGYVSARESDLEIRPRRDIIFAGIEEINMPSFHVKQGPSESNIPKFKPNTFKDMNIVHEDIVQKSDREIE